MVKAKVGEAPGRGGFCLFPFAFFLLTRGVELFFIIALVTTSIVAVTFIVERGIALRWRKIVPQPVEGAVENYNSATDLPILRHAHQS